MSRVGKVESFAQNCFYCPSTKYGSVSPVIPFTKPQYSHLMSVDMSGDEFEVPTFLLSVALEKAVDFSKIMCGIHSYYNPVNKSMVGSILDEFSRTSLVTRLTHIITNRDETYYGCKGLILDRDFKSLFLTTVCFRKEEGVRIPTGIKLRVPQEIFARQDELIPKTIVKKIIPYYCTHNVRSVCCSGGNSLLSEVKPEVVIGNSDNIVLSKVLPSPRTANDKHFNDLLIEHLKDI